MKKITGAVLFALAVGSSSVWAAETGTTYDRSRQWGLGVSAGTTSPGIGARYWLNDKWAVDAGGALSLDTGNNQNYAAHKDWGANGQFVYVLHKRDGLRFESLFGVNYDHNRTDSQGLTYVADDQTPTTVGQTSTTNNLVRTTTVGVGLAVEYSFTELPDLGFSAFATGFGASFVSQNETQTNYATTSKGVPYQTIETLNDSYTTLATKPSIGLSVRYYF